MVNRQSIDGLRVVGVEAQRAELLAAQALVEGHHLGVCVCRAQGGSRGWVVWKRVVLGGGVRACELCVVLVVPHLVR